MTDPLMLHTNLINILYIWLFFLFLGYLWMAAVSFTVKRWGPMASALVLGLLCLAGFETTKFVLPDNSCIYFEKAYRYLAQRPCYLWTIVLILLSGYLIVLSLLTAKWRRCHITTMSIKRCGDEHPAGIVFWKDNGRVLFANAAADRLSEALTGNPVLNGNEFFASLGPNPVRLSDGTVWNYYYRVGIMDGESLYEVTATDITALYGKTKELESNTERLSRMNEGLKAYNRQIEELVRRREMLNAKVRIHDRMNHLLMATGRAFEESDREKQEELLKAWEDTAYLLFREEENERKTNILEDLQTYGELLGIEFVCSELPKLDGADRAKLLVLSAREAMNNAVKHAGARHLYLSFAEENKTITCTFTNDGRLPEKGAIIPSGGLLSLKEAAERLGGSFRTELYPEYKLILCLLKGDDI